MSEPIEPPWSAEQVQALAPDASSLAAARKLAGGSGWSTTGTGGTPAGLWGLCKGSGSTPYQICVDLTEPAYKCSCPSRKFPCKHALALLLRWSTGNVAAAEPPQFMTEWTTSRGNRAARKAEAATAPRTEAQEKAAQRRAAKRAESVAAGVAELRTWLSDQVRHGVAGLDQAGYRPFEQVAARLVDAQAPGLAAAVRRLAPVPSSGPGWEQRLLAELSLLHLLAAAAADPEPLPEELAVTVRSRTGQQVAAEQVLAGPRVRDRWQVVGSRDELDDKLNSRRVWLRGRDTGRAALVLSFAAPGQALPVDLVLGTELDADLAFYPGAAPLRALVADRHGPPRACPDPGPAQTVAQALDEICAALAADPWLFSWPLLLSGALAPGRPWHLVDAAGDALPLDPAFGEPWRLAAVAGGRPVTLAAEWGPAGLRPLAVYADAEVVLA
ncbi:SWIM zinc finger family protein [Catellatospora sp. NPDC049609]|uniref:SWIM zinc finger family protein n=1 Tax=Catellatospora sp. NPDC049609 TaxID=3155505 RepID=UPI003413D55F